MGLRATVIPINSESDLLAFLLMYEALDDVSGYDCTPIIHGFIKFEGNVYGLFSHDGSTAMDFYDVFSPSFLRFIMLDNIECEDNGYGAEIVGAEYLNDYPEFN